jgi:hypothetical protein
MTEVRFSMRFSAKLSIARERTTRPPPPAAPRRARTACGAVSLYN